MAARPWNIIIAELKETYHPTVLVDISENQWHTDDCEIEACTGEGHIGTSRWGNLLDWAQRVQNTTGWELQSFWEGVEEGNYKRCRELLLSTNRYSKRSAKYYEKEFRSKFGTMNLDGTARN